jgi:electron transfer flavoprotein alpha/beta subunit
MPCTTRSSTSSTGASTPTFEKSGSRPTQTVAMPIIISVVISAFLRPIRSPRWPNTRPPIGRAKKPTAKVANDAMVLTNGSCDGKYSEPNTSAAAVA